jgi:hypothetical protein
MNPLQGLTKFRCNRLYLGMVFLLSGMLVTSGCAPTAATSVTASDDPLQYELETTVPPVLEARSLATTSPSTIQTEENLQIMTIEPGLTPLIEQATADLARRLEINVEAIQVLRAESVVWPDASLGCPQPGMKYIQVPEDGALIVLQAEGMVYEYHSGGSRGVFLCEMVYKDPNLPPKIDITDLTPQLLDDKYPPPSTLDNGIPPGEDR